MEPALWGLVGTLVGAIASIATTYIQSRQTHNLQTITTREEREERHRAFQRQTLVELQDVLHDLHRKAASGYFQDLNSLRKSGEWGSEVWSDDLSEGYRLLLSRVMLLGSRVKNDDLRARVKGSTEIVTRLALVRSRDQAELLFAQMNTDGPNVLESIGNELRLQY